MDYRTMTALERAMLSQTQRYNALPRWKRGRHYGRWLYSDIKLLNETLLEQWKTDCI